ncbi:MAG: hypothetical protein R6U56_05335 [Opitutales bacterium]
METTFLAHRPGGSRGPPPGAVLQASHPQEQGFFIWLGLGEGERCAPA